MSSPITAIECIGNMRMRTDEKKQFLQRLQVFGNKNLPGNVLYVERLCDFPCIPCKCDEKKRMMRPNICDYDNGCNCDLRRNGLGLMTRCKCCVNLEKDWLNAMNKYNNEKHVHYDIDCTENLVCFVIPDTAPFANTRSYFERGKFLNSQIYTLMLEDTLLVKAHERPIESKTFKPRLMINAVVRNNRSLRELVRLLLTHQGVDNDVIDWLYAGVYQENQNPDGGFLDNFPRDLRKLVLEYY